MRKCGKIFILDLGRHLGRTASPPPRLFQTLLTFSDLHCGLSPSQTSARELLPVIVIPENHLSIQVFKR